MTFLQRIKRPRIIIFNLMMTGYFLCFHYLNAQSYTPAELINLQEIIQYIEYPAALQSQAIEGKVVIRVWIEADSSVVLDRIIKSPDTLLTLAVLEQISKLKGIPAEREGMYQREGVTFPVQFSLKSNTITFLERMEAMPWKYRPSGLGYVWIDSIEGPPLKFNKMGSIHYSGFLEDGTCFDTSKSGKQKPFEIMVGRTRLIAGWEEAIAVFPAGSRIWLKIPSHLGYGPKGTEGIPPDATLYFDMQILK